MNRALNVLLLLLGVLAVLYFVVRSGGGGEGTHNRLLRIDPEKVTRIEIAEPERTVTLVRSPSGWRLTEPVDYPAVPEFAESAIDVLATMESQGLISTNPEKVKLFGLAPEDAVQVRLYTGAEGAPAATVQVGKLARGISFTYVKVGDSDAVHQVDGLVRIQLVRSVYGWRSKRVISFDPEALARVTFEGKKSAVIVRDGGDWQWAEEMTSPPDVPPDMDETTRVLGFISRLQAAGFVDEPVTNEGPPLLTVSLREPDGQAATDLVVEAEQDGRYRVVVDANPQRFLVARTGLEPLVEDPANALVHPPEDRRPPPVPE